MSTSKEQGLQSGRAEFEANSHRILAELASEVKKSCGAVEATISAQSSRVEELNRLIGSVQQKIAITQLHTSSSIGNLFREKISYWPQPREHLLPPEQLAKVMPAHSHYMPHKLCMADLDHIGLFSPPPASEEESKPVGASKSRNFPDVKQGVVKDIDSVSEFFVQTRARRASSVVNKLPAVKTSPAPQPSNANLGRDITADPDDLNPRSYAGRSRPHSSSSIGGLPAPPLPDMDDAGLFNEDDESDNSSDIKPAIGAFVRSDLPAATQSASKPPPPAPMSAASKPQTNSSP